MTDAQIALLALTERYNKFKTELEEKDNYLMENSINESEVEWLLQEIIQLEINVRSLHRILYWIDIYKFYN